MDLELFIEMLGVCSTSGEERRMADFLKERLHAPGIVEQEVGDGTVNLMFDWSGTGNPSFVFCTHMDTVPPYIPPSVELAEEGETIVKGRGSCDAKGQIVSMYNACLLLEKEGYRDFGLLLLSGEETGSHGAKAYSKNNPGGDFVLVGEPTDNCLATAAKGTESFEVTIPGKACHSGYPEHGSSAVERFVEAMDNLKNQGFPTDPVLGETTWNVGDLHSNNPQNVLSPEISFRIYFRTTFASDGMVQHRLLEACPAGTVIHAFGGDDPRMYFSGVEGIRSKPVSFGSDAPRLGKFGTRAICGPGSILTAHTADEYVLVSDLKQAVDQYVRIFKTVTKEQKNI